MSGTNSSQDPDYVGPVGYEKKTHQTHFQVTKDFRFDAGNDSEYHWVRTAPGRYVRVKKRKDAGDTPEVTGGIPAD